MICPAQDFLLARDEARNKKHIKTQESNRHTPFARTGTPPGKLAEGRPNVFIVGAA